MFAIRMSNNPWNWALYGYRQVLQWRFGNAKPASPTDPAVLCSDIGDHKKDMAQQHNSLIIIRNYTVITHINEVLTVQLI